jgi:16S rRNA processing protein RimM
VHLEGHGGGVPLGPGLEVTLGGRRAMIVERRGTDQRPILRFDCAADRDAAEALRGQEVEVPAATLPEPDPDAYLHVDLIGCRVTAGERELGAVADVLVYPANDVLDIRGGEEPVLLPFVEDVVLSVDVAGRRIAIRDDFL